MGKVLDFLLGKRGRSSPVVWRALFALFSSFVCPIAGLATFHREVKCDQYRVLFECKSTTLKRKS